LQVADRFAVSRYSGNDQEQTLAAYNRLDANIDWQVNKQLTLGVSLDNLTASNYETDIGFPAPDTSALISLRFKL